MVMIPVPTEKTQLLDDVGGLLRRAADGNAAAFKQLCVTHLPVLLRFVRSVSAADGVPPDLAEDITHDALIRALDWVRRHPDRQVNAAWLSTLAANLMHSEARQHRTCTTAEPYANETHDLSVAKVDLSDAVSRLSPDDRDLLQLIYFDSKTPQEVAQLWKLDRRAVYKRLERALRRLRDLIGE